MGEAVDRLEARLTQVRGYTRRSKSGREVQVRAHMDSRYVKGIAKTVANVAKQNQGATVDPVSGSTPSEGFAYAPLKATEVKVPLDKFGPEHVKAFMAVHRDALKKPGNYLGLWEEDGNMYLDVSRVGAPNGNTLRDAQNNEQLAAFDLKTFETIPLGEIAPDGTYVKLHDPFNHPYLRTAK